MEEHLDSNGNIKQTNYYQPREDPRNDSSPYLPIIVDRITGTVHNILFPAPTIFKDRVKSVPLGGNTTSVYSKTSMTRTPMARYLG